MYSTCDFMPAMPNNTGTLFLSVVWHGDSMQSEHSLCQWFPLLTDLQLIVSLLFFSSVNSPATFSVNVLQYSQCFWTCQCFFSFLFFFFFTLSNTYPGSLLLATWIRQALQLLRNRLTHFTPPQAHITSAYSCSLLPHDQALVAAASITADVLGISPHWTSTNQLDGHSNTSG